MKFKISAPQKASCDMYFRLSCIFQNRTLREIRGAREPSIFQSFAFFAFFKAEYFLRFSLLTVMGMF